MPLLEVTKVQKITATVALEESTAKMVNQYAAFLNVAADDIVNQALTYVFAKDKEFQQFKEMNTDVQPIAALRIKRGGGLIRPGAKRGPKPRFAVAN